MNTSDEPRFACDAMCGGLARWLWALGYDATFSATIDDGDLVRAAQAEQRILVSSDALIFDRRLVRDGVVQSLFLPRGMRLLEQVEFVVATLHLGPRAPRCMACGGVLRTVSAEDVGDRVPAKSLIWATEFFECTQCAHVYWNGTHWQRITAVRAAAEGWARRPLDENLRARGAAG